MSDERKMKSVVEILDGMGDNGGVNLKGWVEIWIWKLSGRYWGFSGMR